MIILGISPLDKDATVVLMVDGKVVYAIAEERLSRRKLHAGFPYLALDVIFSRTGLSPREIDRVVYAFHDWRRETALMKANRRRDAQFNQNGSRLRLGHSIRQARQRLHHRDFEVWGLSSAMEGMGKPWWKRWLYHAASSDGLPGDWAHRWQFGRWIRAASRDHRRFEAELLAGLATFGLAGKLERYEHHQTHVANAFYLSGFERALAVTIDAYGSGLSATVSIADESGIQRLHAVETPSSLGTYYEAVTSALGMVPDRHAGKVVGLAAYGDPEVLRDVVRSLFVWEDGGFRIRRASDIYLSRRLACEFPKIDLAAAYQTVLEEVVCRYVRHYVDETGCDSVVLSGGVAANVKLNQRIHEIPGVRRIYIHPNMGDGGCATGAAILAGLAAGQRPEVWSDVYLGLEYSNTEFEAALRAAGLQYAPVDDIEAAIAQLISQGRVVARFDGRMEYGPRALGNRSILYQAVEPAVNQWLNQRLERTEFMPFAPATLYEDRAMCYRHTEGAEFAAQFMTVTFDCTPSMKERCPAAVHVDGTARPQLVSADSNPSFYRILSEYKRITGLSSIINTSFNMHEEPIVCTPEDAVRSFLRGGLDYLAIGNFLAPSPLRSVSSGKAEGRVQQPAGT